MRARVTCFRVPGLRSEARSSHGSASWPALTLRTHLPCLLPVRCRVPIVTMSTALVAASPRWKAIVRAVRSPWDSRIGARVAGDGRARSRWPGRRTDGSSQPRDPSLGPRICGRLRAGTSRQDRFDHQPALRCSHLGRLVGSDDLRHQIDVLRPDTAERASIADTTAGLHKGAHGSRRCHNCWHGPDQSTSRSIVPISTGRVHPLVLVRSH